MEIDALWGAANVKVVKLTTIFVSPSYCAPVVPHTYHIHILHVPVRFRTEYHAILQYQVYAVGGLFFYRARCVQLSCHVSCFVVSLLFALHACAEPTRYATGSREEGSLPPQRLQEEDGGRRKGHDPRGKVSVCHARAALCVVASLGSGKKEGPC